MKTNLTLLLLLTAFISHAQQSFFRGNNNYVGPVISLPTLSATTAASSITYYSANSGGAILDNGGGIISASGICWGTSATPTILNSKTTDGVSSGNFISTLTGLTAGTKYYVRAYATNSAGTGYGAEISFTLAIPITTVTIGSQIWTDKNLDVTMYRNGDPITYAANATEWNAANNAGQGAYAYYGYSSAMGLIYGKLYNWFAVNDSRGLAPVGYHIATPTEWNTLKASTTGPTLKSNTTDWGGSVTISNNVLTISPGVWAGNNLSGFSALPGAFIDAAGLPNQFGTAGWFWTSQADPSNSAKAYWRLLHMYDSYGLLDVGSYPQKYGLSIRLVKD